MSSFPVIDLVFVILIVLMVLHGYAKGFISELFSWATLVLAIWAAVLLYHAGGTYIRSKAMQNVRYVPEILAFLAIFCIITMIMKMLEKVLKDVINSAKLGGANKFLGLIFGFIEGIALTALILFVLTVQPLFDASKILGDSIFAQILLDFIKIPLNRGRGGVNAVQLILPGVNFPGLLL